MRGEWKRSTWGEEISLEYGKRLQNYKDAKAPYRVYGANGPIGWTNEPAIDGPGVILGRKGAYRGVKYSPHPFSVIDTAFWVKPKKNHDMRWLYYAIKHYKLGKIDDGSPIPSTTRSAVYVRHLLVPSLSDQRAIAHILGTLDDKIELNRKMNQTLEAIARAIFKSWFVDFDPVIDNALAAGKPIPEEFAERAARRAQLAQGKSSLPENIRRLFPDEFQDSELGPIPKGWKVSVIGEEFNITMGQSPPGRTYNETGDGLPFFQGRRDFGFRYPTKRVYCSEPKRIAEAGDALVTVRAPVGEVNMAWEKVCIGRGVAVLRHRSGGRSFTYYAVSALQDQFKGYEAEGTVFGSITKQQLSGMKWLASPLNIPERFEKLVFSIDEQIRKNEGETSNLVRLRDALLPKLIRGDIRVIEPLQHLRGSLMHEEVNHQCLE